MGKGCVAVVVGVLLVVTMMGHDASAFVSPTTMSPSRSSSSFVGAPSSPLVGLPRQQQQQQQQQSVLSPRKSGTALNFMGSDGGILGIGTPELFTILLVGYFVLGPSDLYKLVKEIGKFVQNIRTFTTEATATIENNLESNLQLEEIRKAQAELTDAFSFRRSINVDGATDPFEVNVQTPRAPQPEGPMATAVPAAEAGAAAAGMGAAGATTMDSDSEGTRKKKIRRRRVKKKKAVPIVNDIPTSLSVEEDGTINEEDRQAMLRLYEANDELRREAEQEAREQEEKDLAAAQQRREDRLKRLEESSGKSSSPPTSSSSEEELASANARFQAQVNGNWNDQVMAKEGELEPLADIMDRLALLEEEKNAADMRLQEEFRLREENEQRYYREKRQLLEEAAANIQASAYASIGSETTTSNTTATK